MQVPSVLSSGNHGLIEQWRKREILINTWNKRRDLFKNHEFNSKEISILSNYLKGK
jgi:tRNA (guanine37-N1)-methyltransferase